MKKLIHYICSIAEPYADKFGTVKLYKSMWFADLSSYLEMGNTISGEKYVKQSRGPVPERAQAAIDQLVKEGKIAVEEVREFPLPYLKRHYKVLKKADSKFLTEQQKTIVDSVTLHIIHNHTAHSISEATHDEIWEMAEYGEEIPFYTVYTHVPGDIHKEDVDWAKKEARAAS